MPISLELLGSVASNDTDALNPDQVLIQYLCQCDGGVYDPDGTPDERVRPTHRALHGTVWRLDDPSAPIPPTDWGCRCAIRYVSRPQTLAAVAGLPTVTAEAEAGAGRAYAEWLDANVAGWEKIADAAAKAPPAQRFSAGYLAAKSLGVRDREVVRMAVEAKPGARSVPAAPLPPRPPAPVPTPAPAVPAPVVPTSPGVSPAALPRAKQADQLKHEGQPLRRPSVDPPMGAAQPPPEAPPAVIEGERLIARRTTERLLVWDEHGKLIGSSEGGKDYADVPPGLPPNTIMTHNHPSAQTKGIGSPDAWGTALSGADLEVAVRNNVQAIRAVTPAGLVTEMRRPPGGWPDVRELSAALKDAEAATTAELLDRITGRKISTAQAMAIHGHEINSRVAKRFGLIYRWGIHG